jgi:hypothetical protein
MPAQFRALYQQSAQQEPRLEFRLRNQANSAGALTLKQLIDEHARQYMLARLWLRTNRMGTGCRSRPFWLFGRMRTNVRHANMPPEKKDPKPFPVPDWVRKIKPANPVHRTGSRDRERMYCNVCRSFLVRFVRGR